MKALVVRQPWATLIALGVKTIETRPWPPNGPMRPEGVRGLPGLRVERGERIAIVAGSQRPDLYGMFVGLRVEMTTDGDYGLTNYSLVGTDQTTWHRLALGNVVCTAIVEDALPVVADLSYDDEGGTGVAGAALSLDTGDCWDEGADLYLHNGDHFGCGGTDIFGQIPLGDFTPGRWGWLLTDPQPCEPIPVKGRQGVFALSEDAADALKAGAR